MCATDKYGFPIRHRTRQKVQHGFMTGDIVRAAVPSGKYQGVHTGRVTVRAKGGFVVRNVGKLVCETAPANITAIHRSDGYAYEF